MSVRTLSNVNLQTLVIDCLVKSRVIIMRKQQGGVREVPEKVRGKVKEKQVRRMPDVSKRKL